MGTTDGKIGIIMRPISETMPIHCNIPMPSEAFIQAVALANSELARRKKERTNEILMPLVAAIKEQQEQRDLERGFQFAIEVGEENKKKCAEKIDKKHWYKQFGKRRDRYDHFDKKRG